MSVSKRPISSFQELETAADDSDEIHFKLNGQQWLLVDDGNPLTPESLKSSIFLPIRRNF